MAVRNLTPEERAREVARRMDIAGGTLAQVAGEFVNAVRSGGIDDLQTWADRFQAALDQPVPVSEQRSRWS
jgi:hypothetical protein